MRTRLLSVFACGALLLAFGQPAFAQGFGLGPRMSFVRGNLTTGTSSARLIGGTIRMGSSKHSALELAMDYRSYRNENLTQRVRETPIQGSLLIFPVRSAFAPYLLAGAGIYNRMTDDLGVDGAVLATSTERRIGWHMGVGAEFFVARHAAIFVDYRFRFVKFGTPEDGSEAIDIPGSSLIPGLGKLRLSHEGSMWTSGIAFYF